MKWVSLISSANRRKVIRAAQNDLQPVYLSGEAGTGKSAIARWIHSQSPRSIKPFILMTHEDDLLKMAKDAGGGTLVVQDLEHFSPDRQTELRSFLRSRSIQEGPQGLRTMIRARVIVTAEALLTEGSPLRPVFEDFAIHLLSLNDRKDELLDLIENLFAEIAHELKRDHVRSVSPEAINLLMKHEWRGNLRELRNILRYGILRTDSSSLQPEHLPNLKDPTGILLASRAEFAAIEEKLIQDSSKKD